MKEIKNATTIKEWKKFNNLTAPDVAGIFGISREYLFYLMRGNTPGKKLATKINKITGIPLLDLLFPERRENEVKGGKNEI